jgi:hypothetical protein
MAIAQFTLNYQKPPKCVLAVTKISAQQLLGWAGILVPTFTGWRKNYGRAREHNGWIPRDK